MPSIILGNPAASGPVNVVPSYPFSGQRRRPLGGVLLSLWGSASGNAYIGYSGNITMNSGGLQLSGGHSLDGFQLRPGESRLIPPLLASPLSGVIAIYAHVDGAASGQGRLYYEVQ